MRTSLLLDIRIPVRPREEVQAATARYYERKIRLAPKKTRPDHKWTPEEIAQAMELVIQGLSYSEVAKEMGCTKNAICGVVFKERNRLAAAQKVPA